MTTTHTIAVHQLQPGDYIPAARATVRRVDLLGPLAIVDLEDDTSTAPMPAHAAVTVERPRRRSRGA